MELMPVNDRPRVINKFCMPRGNYTNWTADEAFEAELLAKLFANTYIIDFSAVGAAMRLGSPDYDSAATQGSVLVNHWLTQHYIRKLIDSFGATGRVSVDSVSALLWRDANDFSPTANAMARVNAQKCLATAMGMTEAQNRRKETEDRNNVRGGVIWVEARVTDLPDWEAVALEKQAEMMSKLEDDTPVEGVDLL